MTDEIFKWLVPFFCGSSVSALGTIWIYFKYIKDGDCVYFVHSYYAEDCDDSLLATAEYGKELTAAVALGNVSGTQFHPEKSGEVGLGILRAFAEWED